MANERHEYRRGGHNFRVTRLCRDTRKIMERDESNGRERVRSARGREGEKREGREKDKERKN